MRKMACIKRARHQRHQRWWICPWLPSVSSAADRSRAGLWFDHSDSTGSSLRL